MAFSSWICSKLSIGTGFSFSNFSTSSSPSPKKVIYLKYTGSNSLRKSLYNTPSRVPVSSEFSIKSSRDMIYLNINYNSGGENMEALSGLGIFFAGLGILLASFGLFWFVSLYSKNK